jgi:hypothetical protein
VKVFERGCVTLYLPTEDPHQRQAITDKEVFWGKVQRGKLRTFFLPFPCSWIIVGDMVQLMGGVQGHGRLSKDFIFAG